jgi:hypothetical protein
MGRTEQPFLYDAPKYDTKFNPKSVTEASLRPTSVSKPKQEGPLLNFNQHPDSWLILPSRITDSKAINPKVAGRIKWTRWIQLFFRILELVGAIGILVCVIMIKGTQDTEGWIIRIPVGQHRKPSSRIT